MTSYDRELSDLLHQSGIFGAQAVELLGTSQNKGTLRSKICSNFVGIALHHWTAQRVLLAADCYTSAVVLLRTQFEVTLKALWVFYAASEQWIDSYGRTDQQGQVKEPSSRTTTEMLNALEKHLPEHAVGQLRRFKELAWKQMNSFTHSGIYAHASTIVRPPERYWVQALVNSNGLAATTLTLAAINTIDENLPAMMLELQHMHLDCLPFKASGT